MTRTIKTFLTTTVLVLLSFGVQAQEEKNGLTWYTNVNQVYKLSTKTKKPVFAFFTGSDWCGWCRKLQAAVFAKPEFQAWAKKSVILFEVDFPHTKKLPDSLAQQNNSLQQVFKIQSFPTIWIFNMTKDKGTEKFNIAALGSLGYPRAEAGKEAEVFVDDANRVLKNK